MGIWQRIRGVEKRQSSYTDSIVSLIQNRAGGSSALPGATAALESASGFVARSFASADVTTADSRMASALDPSTLSMIGRSLIRNGQYVAAIQVDLDGRIRLAPAASFDVTGNENPESWVYRLSLSGPGRQKTFENIPADGVVSIRYQSDQAHPWRGVGPLEAASLAGRLSAEVSSALADEMSGPRGSLLPVANADGNDPSVVSLRADIKGLNGSLAFVESQANSFGTDQQSPRAGWDVRRLGADIPEGSIKAAELAFSEVLASCGLSTALWDGSQSSGRREAYRIAIHQVVAPLGRIAAAELSAKLQTSIRFEWTELGSADISSRARAFQSLVKGGIAVEKAAALSGLMIEDN